MGRKNIFDALSAVEAEVQPSAKAAPVPEVFQYGPVGAMRTNLRDIGARTIQDLDPDMIEDTGYRDRLPITEVDVAGLRASIDAHGQQVPILVRPHPRFSGRFQVVYGRRRLMAIRGMGIPVKAMVRTMSDREAVLAQGQENSVRKDPSFIEKALFAAALRDAGYDGPLILDALNLNRAILSQMDTVTAALPPDLIFAIGPAESVGRRRWMDLANGVKALKGDPMCLLSEGLDAEIASDARFDRVERAVKAHLNPVAPLTPRPDKRMVRLPDGQVVAEILTGATRLRIVIDKKQSSAFGSWLEQNGDALLLRLHAEFTAVTAS